MAHLATIPLARIEAEAASTEADELSPSEYADSLDPIILEPSDQEGGWNIVDGFHRTSGLSQWAASNGVDPESVFIEVVETDEDDDEDLIGMAGDGWHSCNEEAVGILIRTAQRKGPVKRMIRNAADLKMAKRYRETFMDRPASKAVRMKWDWPKQMQWVGYCESVMYTSDKWHNIGDYEDYKHVAEAHQNLYCRPRFIRDYHNSREVLDIPVESVKLPKKMPSAFAVLADIFGVHVETFDDRRFQVDIARAKLGGAECAGLGTFLFVYTEAGGVHMIITGEELAIERDGITG